MITIIGLSKNFTGRTLFKDVNLSIFSGEKIGLTGPNGSGKSTLFSIIRGQMESTGGSVQMQKNLNIGHLAQEAHFSSKQTVMDEVTAGDARIKRLLQEKHELEDANKADSVRYGDILEELETAGIYELENKAERILSGLGFKAEEFHKPVNTLSGGWQMRTLLAKLLLYAYDIILLDEPTNYLDLHATLWLKGFLASYPGTFIIISHDKIFLNDVTNYTIVLENGQMTKIKGNYQAYEEQKNLMNKSLEKQQKVLEQRKDQLEKFAQRFHAQPNRASAVRNKRKMLEKIEEQQVDLPQERRSIRDFEFPATQESGYVVATAQGLSKAYGDKQVYKNLDLEIIKGQKICLIGPNGAGKSTLLKMLADIIEPDEGQVKLGFNVTRGYFSQTRLDVLNPNNTALEELATASSKSVPAVTMRTLLSIFNFRGDDVFKHVKILSGGEKSRLILAKLLLNPPNFVLLDEPTTHLDIDGVEALTECFQKYQGTLVFISHDLFFVQQIADYIIEVDQGRIKIYAGGLDYYLDKKASGETLGQESERAVREQELKIKEDKRRAFAAENSKMQEARAQHNQALKRLSDIKKEIKALEVENKEIESESYVKARVLSNAYGKDPDMLKEYGQRLKWIAQRQREIETTIKQLVEERGRISK
jgi:ATP-binding cassette subfamily F protein 3